MLNLLLTRHGHSLAGDVVLGGQIDVSLSPRGCAEADALRRRLAGIHIDRIISSPLLRALETAQAVATGRPVQVDDRLRELDYGRWEGLTEEEIRERDPELRARWEDDPAGIHSPGGESGEEVARRLSDFLRSLLSEEAHPGGDHGRAGRRWAGTSGSAAAGSSSRPPGSDSGGVVSGGEPGPNPEPERRVLVVAHGTVNRILLCVALGSPVGDYRRRFVQDRAGLTVLRFARDAASNDGQLALANDLSHLRELGEAPWG